MGAIFLLLIYYLQWVRGIIWANITLSIRFQQTTVRVHLSVEISVRAHV